jgi:predicted PurR-regulated permease PerM
MSARAELDMAFLRRVLIVGAVLVLAVLIWQLSEIILLVFGSVLVAVMLRSLARPLKAYAGMNEKLALALVVSALTLTLVAGAALFGAELAEQIRGLSERLSTTAGAIAGEMQLESFADLIKGDSPASSIGLIASRLVAWSSTLLGGIASLLLVIFAGVYLAIDPHRYRAGLVKLVPPYGRPTVETLLDDTDLALRRWLGAQLVAMALVGTLTGLGMWLIGLPSALALGLIAGLTEFVPILGPIAGAIPAIVVASAQDWQTVLWAIGVIVAVQQLENNVITPLVVGRAVAVAPVVALFAIVAMGVLFGPLGLLLGFPLTVVIDAAVRRLYLVNMLGERVEIAGRTAKT